MTRMVLRTLVPDNDLAMHTTWGCREGDALTRELTTMRPLGGGPSYETYLAFDAITYSPVVVKVLRPESTTDPRALRELSREVDALSRLSHPAVERLLRHELTGARPHLVLEHYEGSRLSSLVQRLGALRQQWYLPLAIEIASVLQHLRMVGWMHLDINPSNIIMGSPARLIDLSLARPVAAAAEVGELGAAAYLAPEQCAVGGTPSYASDVWGLGVTLFEAIAGRRAFDVGDLASRDPRVRYPQVVDDPYSLPVGVPRQVEQVVLGALEKDPRNRPLPDQITAAIEPVLARQPGIVDGSVPR